MVCGGSQSSISQQKTNMIPASSTKDKNQKGSAYEDDQEAVDPAIEDDHAVPCSTPSEASVELDCM